MTKRITIKWPVRFLSCVFSTVHCWSSRGGNIATNQSILLLWTHVWQSKLKFDEVALSKYKMSAKCSLSHSDYPARPAHLQVGARVWCLFWQPVRLWCSWKPSGGLWVLQPRSKWPVVWSFPYGVWPSDDASCNAASGSRGPALLTFHSYLHVTAGDHLTDGYQLGERGLTCSLCLMVSSILSFKHQRL